MTRLRVSILVFFLYILSHSDVWSQSVPARIATAFNEFQNDPQMRNGIASFYVADAETGKVVFEQNGLTGMAPASTQKLITSISAYQILGKEFRYETKFAYQVKDRKNTLILLPGGDPTLGSWRWHVTKERFTLQGISNAFIKTGLKNFSGVIISDKGWDNELVPDGWLWQDIGNYYGAGANSLNWRENQYDVFLSSGNKIGDPVSIVKTFPKLYNYSLQSELISAPSGSGDNAYIYFPVSSSTGKIKGTIPVNEKSFKISGSMPNPVIQFVNTLSDSLKTSGITLSPKIAFIQNLSNQEPHFSIFHTIQSPPLDSIIYAFNRKSVNLFGEALIKSIAIQADNISSTSKGTQAVKNYWVKQGIPESELHIVDGSGLSPLNRVTTHAQVEMLLYAQGQNWFDGFYRSLPVYNGMKVKSGTIHGVKGYTGYHTSKEGKTYAFSFLVNNYNGSSSSIVNKMYKVLDTLK